MLPKKVPLKLLLDSTGLFLILFNLRVFSPQQDFNRRSEEGSPGRMLVLLESGKDRDGDGLSDQAEKQYGTNPKSPDTDQDGLVDTDEVLIYHTNPLQTDSDNDGLSDFEELMRFLTSPRQDDTDQDGLPDGAEVFSYHTNPLKADTDNDGLTDGEELTVYHTQPLIADSDSDGVSDGVEVLRLVSNPNSADTDGDGIADGLDKCPTEAGAGNSYAGAEGCPDFRPQIWVEVDQVIVLVGVNFLAGAAQPTPQSQEALDKVYNTLRQNEGVAFEIQGHADGAGDEASNLRLSQRRAEAVFEYLAERGIATSRLRATGLGENNPIASDDTPQGRAQNRRIELHRLH